MAGQHVYVQLARADVTVAHDVAFHDAEVFRLAFSKQEPDFTTPADETDSPGWDYLRCLGQWFVDAVFVSHYELAFKRQTRLAAAFESKPTPDFDWASISRNTF